VLGLCSFAPPETIASAAPKTASKSAPPNASQQAAHTLLDRGRDQLKKGLAADAMSSFLAAKQLDDSLVVASAIADASVALGNASEARAGYAAALDRFRPSLSASDTAASQAKLAELTARTAQLELSVSEAGVDISLDGALVGQTPLPSALTLNPGKHHLELKKADFNALTSDLELKPGPTKLSFALVAQVMAGKIHVSASDAFGVTELSVNGKVVGLLPWEGEVPLGAVTLVARASNATSTPTSVVVERDGPNVFTLTLAANTGRLAIDTPFADVGITLDGQLVGYQSYNAPVPVGRHHIVLARTGYISQEQDVDIATDGSTQVTIGNWAQIGGKPNNLPTARDDNGIYVRLDLGGAVSSLRNGVVDHCASCDKSGPYGATLGLRAGYRFGWISPELWGMGLLDVAYAKASYGTTTTAVDSDFYGPPRREDYSFFRYGWAAGVAARAQTLGRIVNATGSVGFGLFSVTGQYIRATTGTSQVGVAGATIATPSAQTATSSTERNVAPGLLFDGGVVFGTSPGARLYLGLLLSVEFDPSDSRVHRIDTTLGNDSNGQPIPYGTPAVNLASGTQVRFGPVIGFQFGY
jgi:hypothetical protein